MDYEEVANLSNLTFDKEVTPEDSMQLITQEIVFTIFVMIGIVADTAIIYTIFRFKRLQAIPNIFIANWAIADICSLVVTPSSYRIISIIDDTALSHEFMCILFQGDLIFHNTAIVFMIIVSLDWCIAAYFPRASNKFRSFYKFIIGAVWAFALFVASGLIRLCIKRFYYHLSTFLVFIDYSIILFLVIGLHLSRVVRKCRKNPLNYPALMLTLATVYTASWFIGFQLFLFIEYEGLHSAIAIIMECCIFCSSIINFALLYHYNKDFQACFLQVLKRPEDRYADTLSDAETNGRSSSDKSDVRISLENPNQEVPVTKP